MSEHWDNNDLDDEIVLEEEPNLQKSKIDKRKETSKRNMEKARLAKLAQLKQQKKVYEDYSDSDSSESSDSDLEEFVVKTKKPKYKLKNKKDTLKDKRIEELENKLAKILSTNKKAVKKAKTQINIQMPQNNNADKNPNAQAEHLKKCIIDM